MYDIPKQCAKVVKLNGTFCSCINTKITHAPQLIPDDHRVQLHSQLSARLLSQTNARGPNEHWREIKIVVHFAARLQTKQTPKMVDILGFSWSVVCLQIPPLDA